MDSDPSPALKARIYTIVFEADTRAGRLFDLGLLLAIVLSLVVVVLDSMPGLSSQFDKPLVILEWMFTLIFTVEYLTRLYCVNQRLRYAFSFFGIIDLISVLPTYLALLFPEVYVLIDVRVLRLLRVFRILKLTHYMAEYSYLAAALASSRRKILVFLSVVCMVVVIMGTLMYVVEGPANGFSSIPTSVYWAITTMTTVGFGDITPKTDLGRLIASLMMLTGWGVLAVPTGIVTAEMVQRRTAPPVTTRTCPECLREGVAIDDVFCARCGVKLPTYRHDGIG